MKVMVLRADTFRRDHWGAYGNPWIQIVRFMRRQNVSEEFIASYQTGMEE